MARSLAAGLVVVLHALAALLLWHARSSMHTVKDDSALTWLRLVPDVDVARRPIPTRTSPAPVQAEQQRHDPGQPSLESAPSVPALAPVEPLPPRQIDWAAQATFNAKKTVEDAVTERYRNLGARRTEPQASGSPPSIFSPEAKSFGDLDRDIDDNPRVRLNEHCYFELDDLILSASDMVTSGLPPMVKCSGKVGKREPRGDLFEHLKRERPPPALASEPTGELPELTEQEKGPPGTRPDDPASSP